MNENHTQEKLVVSLLIDNSYAIESIGFCDRLNQFLSDFQTFLSDQTVQNRMDVSIELFDGLDSKTLKDFTDETFDPVVECSGFPLMDRALSKTLSNLGAHLKTQQTNHQTMYKPWFIIISSGLSYDALSAFKDANIMNQINQLTVFPFLMDDTFLDENMIPMNRLKPFMVIKDHQLDALNRWIQTMVKERISKPSSEKMRLDKDSLKDWIYL